MTQTHGDALMACPFCGSADVTIYSNDFGYFVTCEVCDGRTNEYDDETPASAIAAWNRRATPATQVEEPDGSYPIFDWQGETYRLRKIIAKAGRALIEPDTAEAWHQLYAAEDPTYSFPGRSLTRFIDEWDPSPGSTERVG